MVLSEEFKNIAKDGIDQFLENFRASSNDLMYTKEGTLTNYPQDFNFGYAIGYLEGTLSTQFSNMYQRSMSSEENFELRRMLAVIIPEIKQLIFDTEHR